MVKIFDSYTRSFKTCRRGLSSTRLKALTVISNFDSRRDDGTAAAERLFGRSFPDLFTWLVGPQSSFRQVPFDSAQGTVSEAERSRSRIQKITAFWRNDDYSRWLNRWGICLYHGNLKKEFFLTL
ncbi:DUF6399 domain-containing protein [Deltaproteobacteria bacterium TL4]